MFESGGITVPADALAPLGARPSAGIVLIKCSPLLYIEEAGFSMLTASTE